MAATDRRHVADSWCGNRTQPARGFDLRQECGFCPTDLLLGRVCICETLDRDSRFWRVGWRTGPGRALDLAIKVRYNLTDRWGLGVGYRTLEGGVDTDDTYNIAWLNYLFLSVSYRFWSSWQNSVPTRSRVWIFLCKMNLTASYRSLSAWTVLAKAHHAFPQRPTDPSFSSIRYVMYGCRR